MLLTGMCTVFVSSGLVWLEASKRASDPSDECGARDVGGNVPSLTTKPMKPITTKPTPTAWEILMNSRLSAGRESAWCSPGGSDGCSGGVSSRPAVKPEGEEAGEEPERLTFGTPVEEEGSVVDEFPGDIGVLLELVGHGDYRITIKVERRRSRGPQSFEEDGMYA